MSRENLLFFSGMVSGILGTLGMAAAVALLVFWEWLHSLNGIERLTKLVKAHAAG